MSTIGNLEKKLFNMFQNDFLALLQTFRKIDRNKRNAISKQEFRAALESHFSIELSDYDFEEFLKDVPRNSSDQVEYLEFMTKFDSDSASSLFDSQSFRFVYQALFTSQYSIY
jgi:Ca2+-binding EF-hand superfamily protein